MKAITLILVSFLCMISNAFAGFEYKKPVSNENTVNERINGMIGNPVNLLNGHSQSAMISYSIDENNIMHIQEVATANTALKNYIVEHLEGKKVNNSLHDQNGIVRVHFNATESNNIYLQY